MNKTKHRILSVLLVVSILLSAVSPVFADQAWPSERGADVSSVAVPASGISAQSGPVPVPAELRAGQSTFKEEPVSQQGGSQATDRRQPYQRVPAGAAVNLPGQFTRDRSVAPSSINANPKMGPGVSALAAQGGDPVGLVIHLNKPSLAQAGVGMTAEARAAYAQEVAAYQDKVIAEVEAGGGVIYARFGTLSSGFIAFVSPQQIARVVGLPEVQRVAITNDYELDLSETVPMIGAKALQDLGFTGTGVNVAVLDSGIDFTHLAFGGPGTVDAYEAAYFGGPTDCLDFGDPTCANAQMADPALFGPTAPKVKGGWDWVGDSWPTYGPENPDPNPIDAPADAPFAGGHGTHVADIIGGLAFSGKGVGVAPGANLYGYTVCSSVSTSCSGIALLAGMDDAADLDNNPATYDPADVINMSLGSSYGQPEDDLTYFTNQAVSYGAIVVVSAGNSADKPFIVGSPSIASGAVSVAQTTVPSSTRYPIFYSSSAVSGTISTGVWQPWSVLPGNSKIEGPVVYGNADGTNRNGCAPYTTDMTGKVVLADRGACSFSIKAENASVAGAVLSLIGLVAPGDPFEGGYGGGVITIPSFMILQTSSTLLKNQIANGVVAGIDPAQAINLAYTIVGSSSRGPRNHDGAIKPDISAPGASISAITGTGTDIGPFGGTSGAAPMVSGSMALLKGIYGDTLLPQQYKALAMNTGDAVYNGVPKTELSPVTRIGGGQVNVRSAFFSKLIAWDSTDTEDPLSWTGSMSFGYVPASEYQAITRTLTIQNQGTLGQSIALASFFRSNEDLRQGVFVTPLMSTAFVPAGGTIQVPVLLEIYPAGSEAKRLDPLHPWVVNRGTLGANGLALQYQEYDGYVNITPQLGDPIHVVWQVLPKAVADVQVGVGRGMSGVGAMSNASPGVESYTDIFDLVDVNGNDYGYVVGECASLGLPPGCNLSAIDIKEVGVRSYTDTDPNDFLEFAVTLWDEPYRAGQYPVEIDIYIDSNADGIDDYLIFNGDLTLNAADGRNIVFLVDLNEGVARPWYFIDATFNSNNLILPMDAASVGVTPGQPFRFSVFAFDAYFTGQAWDCAPKVGDVCTGGFQYTPGAARFSVPEDQIFPTVPANDFVNFNWNSSPEADMASPSQIGLLFLHRNAQVGQESDYLLMAPPFQAATQLSVTANPNPAAVGTSSQVMATLLITDGVPAVGQAIFFSTGAFSATLSGENEVPTPITDTLGSGAASFVVDFATGVTTYTLDFTGLVTPTMAHVHVGKAGTNGGVAHWLWDANGVNAPSTLPATGVFTMTQGQISALLQEGLYVNVHSAAYPAGEIRGQISGALVAYTNMDGVASVDWMGVVAGMVRVYALSGDLMASVDITFVDRQPAAIHVTADPMRTLVNMPVSVTATVTDNLGGLMVGQPVLFSDGVFTSTLNGANEVPANGSTATATATFTLDPVALTVSYNLNVTGLTDVTGAHVHAGGPGVNGPVVFPLDTNTWTGTVPVTADQLAQMLPMLLAGQFYVNIHTTTHAGGEIRGQLSGPILAMTNGDGQATISYTGTRWGLITLFAASGSVSGSVAVMFDPYSVLLPNLAK